MPASGEGAQGALRCGGAAEQGARRLEHLKRGGTAEHDRSQSEEQSPISATGPGRSDPQEQQQNAQHGCDTVANDERLWQRSQVAMVEQIENNTERGRGSRYQNGKDCE